MLRKYFNLKVYMTLRFLLHMATSISSENESNLKAWPQTFESSRFREIVSSSSSSGSIFQYANFNLKVGSFNIHGQGKTQIKLRKISNLFTKGNFDIFLLQETRTDGSSKELKKWYKVFNTKQIFLTSLGTRAVGAGIVIRNNENFNVLNTFKDPEGRYVGVIGDHEEGKFLVLSFYSPSVSKEIKSFVIDHIYAQLTNLGEELPEFILMGGDTNTPFSVLDKEGGNSGLKNEAIQAFEQLKDRLSLLDSFRLKFPMKREYTWEVLNPIVIKERLDVIFISDNLQDYLAECGVIPAYKTCSDHGIPFVRIKGFDIPSKGPGIWKLNNQLLLDPGYVVELRNNIKKWELEAETDLPNNKGGQWSFIKHKIGEFSRNFGAKLKKAKSILRKRLECELESLSLNLDETNKLKYQSVKGQLDDLIETEVKGAILRSLCEDYEMGEKCSKYFFSLEKYRAKQRTINRLKLPDGSITSNGSLILNECRLFYKNLYSKSPNIDFDRESHFFNNGLAPKLSEKERTLCDTPVTEIELLQCLKTFRKNKSPGLDGSSAEFHLTFWDQLKTRLLDVYEEAFTSELLPESMRVGLVTLLEKKGKDRLELSNWRPITLLNVDYKLLTKTLGQRLKKVLPSLVGKEQNGFIPGGNIFFSAHTVRDILFYCKKENIDLILLALDYSKAFDSLDFEFIHQTFKHFGFGDNFKKWIKVLYKGGKSCIGNNGYISESIAIERSTRQGDPISPLVFILGLEILFIVLRSDENIQGLKVENNELKFTAYADDSTYFMKNKISAELLLNQIELFSKISGLEVNRSKSECLLMSFEQGLSEFSENFLGIPVVENLKILGHYYGKSDLICNYQNFYSKIGKMEKTLNMWKQRNLTWIGKILLINALSTSIFTFNAQIDIPPVDFLIAVEKLHKNFLWQGVPKISHKTLISDYKDGGLKYRDLQSFIDSINLKFVQNLVINDTSNHTVLPKFWVKRLFKIPTEPDEQRYFYEYFDGKLNVLNCIFKLPRVVNYKGHPFYYKILKTYETLLENLSVTEESILSMPIWFNKHLKSKFDEEISKAGFNYLKDIFPENNLKQNFEGLRNVKSRKLLNICNRIPQEWMNIIQNSSSRSITVFPYPVVSLNRHPNFIKDVTSDSVYKFFVKNKSKPAAGLTYWVNTVNLSDSQINIAFRFAREFFKSTFDIVFQYKIITNTLPTNKFLQRYRVLDNDLCSRCKYSSDTIEHRLWSCQLVVPVVAKFIQYLKGECNVKQNINMITFLFGFKENPGLNHILLECKKLIFYQLDDNLCPDTFCERVLQVIRKIMIKEKQIMISGNNFEQYCLKWRNFSCIYDFYGPDIEIFN